LRTANLPATIAAMDHPAIEFTEDYRACRWGTETFAFTALQAACVRILWEARNRGSPVLHQEDVLARAGAKQTIQMRMRRLFQRHPAYQTMIHSGRRPETFLIVDPPMIRASDTP
jgi:hypothetical protein